MSESRRACSRLRSNRSAFSSASPARPSTCSRRSRASEGSGGVSRTAMQPSCPAAVAIGRRGHSAVGAAPAVQRGGLGSVDVHGARPDAGLGDDGVGDPLRDRGDLERPRELDRDGVHPPQLGDLGRHAPVQEAVLDGEPEAVRDRLQVGLVGRLEGHVGAADDEQHPERLVADEQPRPRRVAAAVPAQPVRQRDLTGRAGHDGPRRGQRDVGGRGRRCPRARRAPADPSARRPRARRRRRA